MSTFMISRPHVSNGLEMTYNKDFVIVETKRDGSKIAHTFYPKTNKWKETTSIPPKYERKVGETVSIANIVSGSIARSRDYLTFDTKEEAYLVKAYLIEEMCKEYTATINKLKESLAKNVPDLSSITEILQEEHPEYFI